MGGTKGSWWIAARTSAAAMIGGTASVLGGGKFANGATTAAFQNLFNNEAGLRSNRTLILTEASYNNTSAFEGRKGITVGDAIWGASYDANQELKESGGRVDAMEYANKADLIAKVKANVSKYDRIIIFSHGFGNEMYLGGGLAKENVNLFSEHKVMSMLDSRSQDKIILMHCFRNSTEEGGRARLELTG